MYCALIGRWGSQIINGLHTQIRFKRLIVVKKVPVSLFRDPSIRFGHMSSDLISGIRGVLARWPDQASLILVGTPRLHLPLSRAFKVNIMWYRQKRDEKWTSIFKFRNCNAKGFKKQSVVSEVTLCLSVMQMMQWKLKCAALILNKTH